MKRRMKLTHLGCFVALIAFSGCMSLARTEPAQEHYVLGAGPTRQDTTTPGAVSDLAIGVRRLKLAAYLASSFLVVRRGPNQVDFAEFQRWGEPLEEGINRVVAGALVSRGFPQVAVAPWPAQSRQGYVIQLDVVRFEGLAPGDGDPAEGGVLVLVAWEIANQLDGAVLTRGTTDFRRQGWNVGDYAGLVTLLDEGLGVIADDLAVALAELPPIKDEPDAD